MSMAPPPPRARCARGADGPALFDRLGAGAQVIRAVASVYLLVLQVPP